MLASKKKQSYADDEEAEWDEGDDEDTKRRESSKSSDFSTFDDDVRYLVKWRGLPYNESSWEKWVNLPSYFQLRIFV